MPINRLFLAVLLMSPMGCVSGSYTPPSQSSYSNSIVVQQSFDETWESLISYASASFFGIENFEKESGLLTLSFGADDAEPYIDCGRFQFNAGANNFNGPYVQWAQLNNNATLDGRMNLRVRRLSSARSEVTVNARYIFSTPAMVFGTGIYAQRVPPVTWSFDSGSSDTNTVPNPVAGTPNTRTCVPTGRAEREILNALGASAS